MSDEKTICVVCAWRATCNKKFSMVATTTLRCPDYVRDIALKDSDETKDK